VQGLVYIFIGVAGLAVGVAAYFGFTFTPIEAFVTAMVFVCIAVVMLERQLRRRAENRLEKAIEDLSRLLATDAQAGAVLGQRINALTDENPGKRLDGVEADISVLGTVVRQVAEAVSDLEEARKREQRRAPASVFVPPADIAPASPAISPPPILEPEPSIPLELLKQAIDEGRLIFHIQPIFILVQ